MHNTIIGYKLTQDSKNVLVSVFYYTVLDKTLEQNIVNYVLKNISVSQAMASNNPIVNRRLSLLDGAEQNHDYYVAFSFTYQLKQTLVLNANVISFFEI